VSRLPVRARVTLAFAAAMALLLGGLGIFLYLRFESDLDSTINQGLRSRAGEIAVLLRSNVGSRKAARAILVRQDESLAQVLTTRGRIVQATSQLSRKPALDAAVLRRAASGPVLVRKVLPGFGNTPVRLYATPAPTRGRRLVVVVGTALDDRGDALASLRKLLLIGGPAALILASLVGYAAAAGALRPVEAMRRRAAAISAAEPDERLPLPKAQDELRRLGETLNRMLGRLEATLQRERQFTDDASHELRTPLALHKTELELALLYGADPEELRQAIASGIEETDRLIQLAEGLLVVARSDQGKLDLDAEPLDLRDVFDDVRERFRSRLAEDGRSLAVEAPDEIHLRADRMRVEQALTNMVDNALRHGEGNARLWARRSDGRAEIHVSDRGPGFPPDLIDSAFERFTRGDPARRRGGAGLGLAIVASIARSHGGNAGAANLPEGGADVWIELPLGTDS
jgi:two-component system, OmpR family, sensor kinase